MNAKITAIAAAITLAISSTAFATTTPAWDEPSEDAQKLTSTEHKGKFIENINYEIDFTANIQKRTAR